MPSSISHSDHLCARVARRAGSSFYWSFWLLSPAKRRGMTALYAFSRLTDDLSDGPAPLEERRAALLVWRKSLRHALAGEPADGVFPALVDATRRFGIPENYLFDVIDGVEMDLDQRCYETFDELAVYCRRVASAVGLACLHIWGCEGPIPHESALQCGYAFQLTNMLRDLREDAALGRIYLPRADLRRFEYLPEELLRGVVNDRFRALLHFEIERAEMFYDAATALFPCLRADGRRALRLMIGRYRGLLDEIKRRQGDVFRERVKLTLGQKLAIGCRAMLS